MRRAIFLAAWCIRQAVLHPRTPISLPNPGRIVSPVPWWGSIAILVLGIVTWILSAMLEISELSEPARLMVYFPLGNMFGMTRKLG